jgi:vancomycin resistance protein YoaR
MGRKIDRRELDAELIEAVRGERRRKRHVVSQKPPKRESAKAAANLTKKLA